MEAWMADIKSQFILNFIEKDRWRLLVDGLGNTLKITAVACLIGICIGVIIAIVRSTWDKNHLTMRPGIGKTLLGIVNGICKAYLTVIRGTPVVVQLMIIYYIIFASSRNSLAIAMLGIRNELRCLCRRDSTRRHNVNRRGTVRGGTLARL